MTFSASQTINGYTITASLEAGETTPTWTVLNPNGDPISVDGTFGDAIGSIDYERVVHIDNKEYQAANASSEAISVLKSGTADQLIKSVRGQQGNAAPADTLGYNSTQTTTNLTATTTTTVITTNSDPEVDQQTSTEADAATQPVENLYPEQTTDPSDINGAVIEGDLPVENPSPEPVDAEAAIAQNGDVSNNVENPSAPSSTGSSRGLQGAIDKTQASGTEEATVTAYRRNGDWRVRLSLAPESNYLYNSSDPQGLLAPLKATNGVIFPYLPTITTSYVANYDQTELTHSNYKVAQYKSSGVDSVSIAADFTAQDTAEANYLLAVIHFFRTVTKMFYGQDSNPKPGTPPPLCFLTGLGNYQFDNHPLVLNSFSYALPNDVDYIKATISDSSIGKSASNTSMSRLPDNVRPGGQPKAANFSQNNGTNSGVTYVPTKMQITINAFPVVSRNAVSNEFSLQQYATGALLQGSTNSSGGGFW